MSAVRYTHSDGVAEVILANPPQNRLSNEVMMGFAEAVTDLQNRSDTRVVCIKADGPDFSFGGDIGNWVGITHEAASGFIEGGISLSNILEQIPVPVVVAVQGHCLGGGFELALRADVIVASEDALFGHPEPTIGIFTLLGGIQRVAERVGKTRAMQWAITAEHIVADEAKSIGLINEVAPLDQLESTTTAWVERLASGPTLAHKAHKKILRAWSDGGIEAADQLMPSLAAATLTTKDAQGSIAMASEALSAGKPRPNFPFKGE